ncbi:MAG: hypothetical protein HZA94_02140 [Candidatus Vogelbacteria bacterium]|nr:hypothetical protein [Candidatus Vogelbacteria bacterium]
MRAPIENKYLDEESYKTCVTNLTLKYLDILVIVKTKGCQDKFLLGKRNENLAKGMFWLAGGRSKQFIEYNQRASELVAEDFGVSLKSSNLIPIGYARLLWTTGAFTDKNGSRINADSDVSLFSVEIAPETVFKTGQCFSDVKLFDEDDACKQNEYVNYAIDCYNYHKRHGTPNPWLKEIDF